MHIMEKQLVTLFKPTTMKELNVTIDLLDKAIKKMEKLRKHNNKKEIMKRPSIDDYSIAKTWESDDKDWEKYANDLDTYIDQPFDKMSAEEWLKEYREKQMSYPSTADGSLHLPEKKIAELMEQYANYLNQ